MDLSVAAESLQSPSLAKLGGFGPVPVTVKHCKLCAVMRKGKKLLPCLNAPTPAPGYLRGEPANYEDEAEPLEHSPLLPALFAA